MTKHVTVEEVQSSIGKDEIVLIDVRTPEEYAKGTIRGSINIPVDAISQKIQNTVPDRNKHIYLFCLSGSRSDVAANMLAGLGYMHAYSMTSGLLMWRFKKFGLN